MMGKPDDSSRTMRDTFDVWNLDTVEREVVLRSSDDQYVAIPLPEEDVDVFERLANTSGTLDVTLLKNDGTGASWQLDKIHTIDEVT